MNKTFLLVVAVLIILLGFFLLQKSSTQEAPDGYFDELQTTNETIPNDVAEQIAEKENLIQLTSPAPMSVVKSPLIVSGMARGPWFFEASFPVMITDWDGRILAETFATAEGEWMTEDFVPFSATINFEVPEDTAYQRGTLILRKDNPSGLPEHDDALEIPVLFE